MNEDDQFDAEQAEIRGRTERTTTFGVREVQAGEVTPDDSRRYVLAVTHRGYRTLHFVSEADLKTLALVVTTALYGELPTEA